jgi:hypothetical protein
VRRFAVFLGRAPDTATVEDLRRFQLHLVDHGTSPVSLNAAITGLKFFFEVTLGHGELLAKMQPVRVPHTLPVVLSRDEVSRLIAAARNLKHQTALSVAYGTGLLANAGRREHLVQARELLHAVSAVVEPPSAAAALVVIMPPTFVCPHCGAAMSIVEIFARGKSIRAPPTLRVAA